MVIMAETYCGKSCTSCEERAALNCPGCRMGPGRTYGGDCSIAKCCVSRNLHSCTICTAATTCFNRRSSSTASSTRLKKQMDEVYKQQRLFAKCELLGNWLGILFWLVIISMVARLILNDSMLLAVPELKIPAALIDAGFGVFYAVILLRLSAASGHYRTAGFGMVFYTALNLLLAVLGESVLSVVLTFVAIIPSFILEFQEYMGHSDATEELDSDMARKWRTLWYWNLGCLCATVLGTLLTLTGLLIAVLIVLLATIGTIVVAIIKIIYLYRTGKAFRQYVKEIV